MTAVPAQGRRGLLLVDDHAIVREGLRRVLEPLADEWNLVEAASAFQALDCLRREPFALAVVDLSMPGMTGLDLIARIRSGYPDVKILVLSVQSEDHYAMRAFKAGANGYLSKDCAASDMITAIRKVMSGGTHVSLALAERVVSRLGMPSGQPLHDALSNRELDVLQRIVAGQRLTDIAAELHLSVKTVSTHKTRIQEKLRVSSTAGLIRYGVEHDISSGLPRLDERDSGP